MPNLQINILNRLEVRLNDNLIARYPTARVQALLLILAVQPNYSLDRAQLASLLWSEINDSAARRNLRRCLLRLRQTVGDDHVEATRQSITLISAESDYQRLQSTLNNADRADKQQADGLLSIGQLAGDFSLKNSPLFDEWLDSMRQKLLQQKRDLIQKLTESQNTASSARLNYAQQWVALEPLAEEAHRAVLKAYAAQDDAGGLMAHYDTFSAELKAELGVDPSAETKSVLAELKSGLTNVPLQTHNFPAQLTAFVGRDADCRVITTLLSDPACRMVTLLGAGGIGKTRLAIQVASSLPSAQFEDGVYFVPLVTATSAHDVLAMLHHALALPTQGDDLLQHVLDHLHNKQLLLLLDNVEQLAGELRFLAKLLQTAAGVKILVTSRDVVGVSAEHRYPISGVDNLNDATAILWSAIKRISPDFVPSDADGVIANEICELVHSVPLALELAATWSSTLDLASIRDEIADGYDFLESPLLDSPDRHRSLRSIFEYSWALLNEKEQQILAQASLFEGGFGLKAARSILGARVNDLRRLVEQSLLTKEANVSGQPHYSLHQLVREFSADQLHNPPHLAHAQYYLTLVAEQEEQLASIDALAASEKISAELANIQAAWRWAVSHADTTLVLSAVSSLTQFFRLTGRHAEGNKLFTEAVASVNDDALLAKLHLGIASCCMWQSRFADCGIAAEQAHALATKVNDHTVIADSLLCAGRALRAKGELLAGMMKLQQAVAASQPNNDDAIRSEALSQLALMANFSRQRQLGTQFAEEGMQAALDSGNKVTESFALAILAFARIRQTKLTEALSLANESLAIARQTGHRSYEGLALMMRGRAHLFIGNFNLSLEDSRRSGLIYQSIGEKLGQIFTLLNMMQACVGLGLLEEALMHSQVLIALAKARGAVYQHAYACSLQGMILAERNRWDEAEATYQLVKQLPATHGLSKISHIAASFGFASVALVRDSAENALAHIDSLVDEILEGNMLDLLESYRFPVGYHVLAANNDPRTKAYVKACYDFIMNNASHIDSATHRRSYLENVPAHRMILSIYADAQTPDNS